MYSPTFSLNFEWAPPFLTDLTEEIGENRGGSLSKFKLKVGECIKVQLKYRETQVSSNFLGGTG